MSEQIKHKSSLKRPERINHTAESPKELALKLIAISFTVQA